MNTTGLNSRVEKDGHFIPETAMLTSTPTSANVPMPHGRLSMEPPASKNLPTSQEPSVQFLNEAYDLFKPLPTDRKDVSWAIEMCRENIVNTDLMLQQMVKEMINTVQRLVHGLATQVIDVRSKKTLELLEQLRHDDITIEELERGLGATHNMSHELFERITSILSTSDPVVTPRPSHPAHSMAMRTNTSPTSNHRHRDLTEESMQSLPTPPLKRSGTIDHSSL